MQEWRAVKCVTFDEVTAPHEYAPRTACSVRAFYWKFLKIIHARTRQKCGTKFAVFLRSFNVICLQGIYIYIYMTEAQRDISPEDGVLNIYICIIYIIHIYGMRGGVVVKALRYKPAGRGFDFRWCTWNFLVT